MNRKRLTISLIVLCILALLCLAACGGDEGDDGCWEDNDCLEDTALGDGVLWLLDSWNDSATPVPVPVPTGEGNK